MMEIINALAALAFAELIKGDTLTAEVEGNKIIVTSTTEGVDGKFILTVERA